MKQLLRVFLILLFSVENFSAQDIHFSHVNRQPLYQNPGNTGLFRGDIRLTGNYKDQWRNVSVPFSTVAFGADAKWKPKKINVGGLFFYDQVGDGRYKTIELQVSISKQLKFTSDSVHCVSVGLQTGLNYRQISTDNFYYDNQFDGIQYDASLPSNENFNNDSKANIGIAVGAVYSWNRSLDDRLTAGISCHNINKPNQGFYGEDVQRDRRLSLFANYDRALNDDWAIVPGLSWNFQGKYRELLLGTQARYTLINKLGNYKAVDAGIWFRSKDAVIIRAGIAIQNWSVAISYDTNISQLVPASNARGGLELSAHYIISRFKPKNILHRVCPDYI